MKVDDADIDLG